MTQVRVKFARRVGYVGTMIQCIGLWYTFGPPVDHLFQGLATPNCTQEAVSCYELPVPTWTQSSSPSGLVRNSSYSCPAHQQVVSPNTWCLPYTNLTSCRTVIDILPVSDPELQTSLGCTVSLSICTKH